MTEQEKILKAKILIVDDEPLSTEILSSILNKAGYENIKITHNPKDVASLYLSYLPNIIILDINMPDMDGYEVMSLLKKIQPNIYLPILVITSLQGKEEKIKVLQLGAQDFIHKPYDRVEVLTRIRNLININLLHEEISDQNIILEQKVRQRTRELYDVQLDVIQRLARAVEFRDNETGMHIIRMSQLAYLLAQKMGLSETDCDFILSASPLHDIGKIGIPDSILLKPGKLTPDEWEIMKTHTVMGADLLANSKAPMMMVAKDIAATHHERWDGTGYPMSMKETQIPLSGRICCLCDVFDALTTARPYKQAWPLEDAFEEIKKQRGKFFDPDIVDCFIDNFDKVVELNKTYADSE